MQILRLETEKPELPSTLPMADKDKIMANRETISGTARRGYWGWGKLPSFYSFLCIIGVNASAKKSVVGY